jgi:signal transduction histidine kinase
MAGGKIRADDGAAASNMELVNLCHDLRQYISAGLMLSNLPGDESLDPETFKRLQLIHQQFVHAADLVSAAGADFTPHRSRLDLASLVDECVRLVKITRDVDIDVDAGPRLVAYGDPVSIRRALVNVLDNASRAAGPNGRVRVSLVEEDASAGVEVADDGHGFGQIEPGSGRGLSIVHAAVTASRGRMVITSGPGPGTQVRLMLPTGVAGDTGS